LLILPIVPEIPPMRVTALPISRQGETARPGSRREKAASRQNGEFCNAYAPFQDPSQRFHQDVLGRAAHRGAMDYDALHPDRVPGCGVHLNDRSRRSAQAA